MGADLVGPLVPVMFYGGRGSFRTPYAVRYYPPLPANTCDPRVPTCLDHHTACDCREAEQAELVAELRIELQDFRRHEQAVKALALLHRPDPGRADYLGRPYCPADLQLWPCPTFALISDLLPDYLKESR